MTDETNEQKWKLLAVRYRRAADALRNGPQRALLIRKARRLETAVGRKAAPVDGLIHLRAVAPP